MIASRNAAASPTVLSTLDPCRMENRAHRCARPPAALRRRGLAAPAPLGSLPLPPARARSVDPATQPRFQGERLPIVLGTPRRVSSLVSHPMRRSLVSAVRLVAYEQDPE